LAQSDHPRGPRLRAARRRLRRRLLDGAALTLGAHGDRRRLHRSGGLVRRLHLCRGRSAHCVSA
jgi:hypothetical protein